MRNPKSVLELGAGRGYVGKRLQDAGCDYIGLEISKHCHMTRVCDPIVNMDMCRTPWGDIPTEPFELSFSMATLEHIPEEFVAPVLRELGTRCRRHLHGIDFGGQDDGFDKTHCTLKDASWWDAKFREAGLVDFEIVNKEDLQKWHSGYPEAVHKDDGKRKLNVGCYTTMFRHNWINVDVHDLAEFARQNYCHYLRHDCRQAIPYDTGSVDLIFAHHFLEHLTQDEALKFLKECRRLLKPDVGAMRIVVPDADHLMWLYSNNDEKAMDEYAHINDGVEQAKTLMGKLNALLHAGHQSFYDEDLLSEILTEAGFVPLPSAFRVGYRPEAGFPQILQETSEMDFGGISLFMNARPKTA
jgi:predicted SAM-dependent methyltransferase